MQMIKSDGASTSSTAVCNGAYYSELYSIVNLSVEFERNRCFLCSSLGYARVSHGGLSDTEIQMAKFRIPPNPNSFTDNDVITTDASKVDASVRFSDE